jgi:hypothetical protein
MADLARGIGTRPVDLWRNNVRPPFLNDFILFSSAAVNLNDGAPRLWVSAPLPLYWYLRVSARWCVAPSVNARTARAFLFIRLSALQYMNLSDYGSLRLRWNREPSRSRFSLLRSCFRSFNLELSSDLPPMRTPECVCNRASAHARKCRKHATSARVSARSMFCLYLSGFRRRMRFRNSWHE